MKKHILVFVLFCFSITTFAQLTTVVSSKQKEVIGDTKNFIIVDVASQYVISKEPTKYDPAKEMPSCYFTSITGNLTGVPYGGNYRNLVINTLVGPEKDCWVVSESKETKEATFARRKFLLDFKAQYCWVPRVDGDYVVFLNLQGAFDSDWGGYLSLNEEGKLQTVKTLSEASRFKLIEQ